MIPFLLSTAEAIAAINPADQIRRALSDLEMDPLDPDYYVARGVLTVALESRERMDAQTTKETP
jgi:hypothetical protein